MSNGSPSAYLLWAILSCIFLIFLIFHLWAFDRFQCLRWDAGRQPGAFKRVMTYSYLTTVPLLIVFSVAMTYIKFSEGFIIISSGKIIPKPFILWTKRSRHWLLPLYFLLSIAWSLELVTHLEELTFWLFLLHQGPKQRRWFHSWEFRTWCLGSITAILGMPLTTLVTRHHLESCQAYIFLVGSSAGTSTTLCFLYVLYHFPAFIQRVKAEGVEPDVIVRLTTVDELNRIRIMFRFLFTVPLLILAVDGIRPPYSIVAYPFALDFLLMIGGLGCFISSALTLLIFFPRSFAHEAGYKAKMYTPRNTGNTQSIGSSQRFDPEPRRKPSVIEQHPTSPVGTRLQTFRFPKPSHPRYPDDQLTPQSPTSRTSFDRAHSPEYDTDFDARSSHTVPGAFLRRVGISLPQTRSASRLNTTCNRSTSRREQSLTDHDLEGLDLSYGNRNLKTFLPPVRKNPHPECSPTFQVHPYVLHFRSPIDLVDPARTGIP